jgi:hypothetical protein
MGGEGLAVRQKVTGASQILKKGIRDFRLERLPARKKKTI